MSTLTIYISLSLSHAPCYCCIIYIRNTCVISIVVSVEHFMSSVKKKCYIHYRNASSACPSIFVALTLLSGVGSIDFSWACSEN